MKKFICFMIVCAFSLVISGCGKEELTMKDAEKAIRSDEPWLKNHEFKILEGDFLPKTISHNKDNLLKKKYYPFYAYLHKAGFIKFEKRYGYKKPGPGGEKYLTDIFKITLTEKIKPLIKNSSKETTKYGVYPPEEDTWQNKETTFNLHTVEMKLIDYQFNSINSINDLRNDSSSSGGCDVLVNFSYTKKFTALGKIVGEFPGGRTLGDNPKTDRVVKTDACLQLLNGDWKVEKSFATM